jgi:hypothetical protein
MATKTRRYTAKRLRYEGMSSRAWKEYQDPHRISSPYDDATINRFKAADIKIRAMIVEIADMTEEEVGHFVREHESAHETLIRTRFSEPTKTRRAKLEPETFHIGYLVEWWRAEIAWLIGTGEVRRHTHFLCQDRRP